MLNYVWIGLLFLGLAAGIITDVSNSTSNKYRNGHPIAIQIGEKLPVEAKSSDLPVTISKHAFQSVYNSVIESNISVDMRLTPKGKDKFTAYFKVSEGSPEIWKEMAQVNGKADDLTGEILIQNNQAYLFVEKVSFSTIKQITDAALNYAKTAVEIALGLIGIMALWLGIMKVAEEAGLISIMAKALSPVMKRLFPEVPSDHPAIGSIIMNISANILGLSNAATPFGLKAMEELQKLNPVKDTATKAMCMFLAINTAGLTLIPATAIAIRAAAGSSMPAVIIGTAFFGSLCATITGIMVAKIFEGFPLSFAKLRDGFAKNKKLVFGILIILIGIVVLGVTGLLGKIFSTLDAEILKEGISLLSVFAIPAIIMLFMAYGLYKKLKVYEVFIEGAKEGFNVAVRIIPYLVGMLFAIGIFRAGGAMDFLIYLLRPATDLIGMPAEALPMALMRPLSGSGSIGIMTEIIAVHGPDTFLGVLVSTFYGSSETTFYVLAVYFGSVNVKKTRYALTAGLLADLAGVLGALTIVKLLFG